MICGTVGAANCTDRDGLEILCWLNKDKVALPKKIYADLGYSGKDMQVKMKSYGVELETIGRNNKTKFAVEPKRWIVERTFAWLGKCRRMSKDYELLTDNSMTMIYLGMSRLMLRRLNKL
jgi:putative transposase